MEMRFVAQEKKLDPEEYKKAQIWEDCTNAVYEAKAALNVSNFAYAGTTDPHDEEKAWEIYNKYSDMHNEYRALVEGLFDALFQYRRNLKLGYLESYQAVFMEYADEESANRKERANANI